MSMDITIHLLAMTIYQFSFLSHNNHKGKSARKIDRFVWRVQGSLILLIATTKLHKVINVYLLNIAFSGLTHQLAMCQTGQAKASELP